MEREVTPTARYTPYHPRWYRRRVSVWWWLQKWPYTRFVLRELTSVSVAWFAVMLLWMLRAVADGPEAYARVVAWLQTPVALTVHAVAFAAVLFHAITWFNLAPKAMVIRVRGRRVPDWIVAAGNYGAWVVLSATVAWILLRG